MTWVMPSRLQTKLTSSDALRGITGWGEPMAQQSSWTAAPYCSPCPRDHSPQLLWRQRCAGLHHTRGQKGRWGPTSSGDTLFMAAPSICQTSRQGLPSSQGLGSMLPQGPGWGSLQPPPFRPALFQPPSRFFLKLTPRHSDHISKVPSSCTALLNHALLVVKAAVPSFRTCFL